MTDQEVGALLVAADGDDGAAAHQGSFFGLACALDEHAADVWQGIVLEDWPPERREDHARAILSNGAGAWLRALRAGQLAYALLLPADDQSLATRTVALGQWCQGFLFGLAQGGIKDFSGLPGDVPEFIDDVVAISQAVADGTTNDDENAYAELCEYVRVGAQLVFDELATRHAHAAQETH